MDSKQRNQDKKIVKNMIQAWDSESQEYTGQDFNQIMVELGLLRKESMRLQRVNLLHARLAALLDFAAMVEAFSVWLMPFVPHVLVAYNNGSQKKKHLFCSCHGPKRRGALALAETVLKDTTSGGAIIQQNGYFAHKWSFESHESADVLLVVKEHQDINKEETQLINESLAVLVESLERAFDYGELFEQASSDPLTKLGNRRHFENRIHPMMAGAKRYNRPLAMVSLDLDNFKDVNDNLGHLKGDEVLCAVARTLEDAVRNTDVLIRMGGDEFIVVLDDTDLESATNLAGRLCTAVADLNISITEDLQVGASIGLTQLHPNEELVDWMERTDDVLYWAKNSGRGRVCVG